MNQNKQYPEIDWNRIALAVSICAVILVASALAFADSRNGCDNVEKLPPIYQNVATCKSWEEARREYNSKRDHATIPRYEPYRHLVSPDVR